MTLAFFKVDNSIGYYRHYFDGMPSEEIRKALEPLLKRDEVRFYGIEEKGIDHEFVEDYNDEILDGGWWCVTF